MDNYEITLTREVLREKSVEILADYDRYIEKNAINDEKNPIFIILKNIENIYREIFKLKYDSMKALDEANGKLDLAKDLLKELR